MRPAPTDAVQEGSGQSWPKGCCAEGRGGGRSLVPLGSSDCDTSGRDSPRGER